MDLVGVATAVALVVCACTPAQRQAAKTAVDVAEEVCRFTFGDKPELVPQGLTLEQFCHTAENYQPFLDEVLSAKRNGVARMRTRVLKDAGAD